MATESAPSTKIVILGADKVGKSAMAFCYWLGKWPREKNDSTMDFDYYIPKVGVEEELCREMPETGEQLFLVDTTSVSKPIIKTIEVPATNAGAEAAVAQTSTESNSTEPATAESTVAKNTAPKELDKHISLTYPTADAFIIAYAVNRYIDMQK